MHTANIREIERHTARLQELRRKLEDAFSCYSVDTYTQAVAIMFEMDLYSPDDQKILRKFARQMDE